MKRIIIDLDETLTLGSNGDYENATPNLDVIAILRTYKAKAYEIAIHTSRNMRTYEGRIGKINVHTLPVILNWLKKHDVPHDEVHVGKPWCGTEGFYVDDRAIRPSEFLRLNEAEIKELLSRETSGRVRS
jgi:capsule biosynthesis phosphatase